MGATTTTIRGFRFSHQAKDGEDGAPGAPGPLMPIPRLWRDYSDSYHFDDGTNGIIDVVMDDDAQGNVMLYECIQHHTKNINFPPTNTTYWRQYDNGIFNLTATKLLLAASAFIDMLNSQGIRVGSNTTQWGYFGTPLVVSENGANRYAILLTGGGKAVGRYDPNLATFFVDRDGYLRVGARNGQRVVLNPLTQEIEVFNSANEERIRITGADIGTGGIIPSGGSSNGNKLDKSASNPDDNVSTEQVLVDIPASSANRAVTVTMPKVTLSVRSRSPNSAGEVPTGSISVRVRAVIDGVMQAVSQYGYATHQFNSASSAAAKGSAPAFTDSWDIPAGKAFKLVAYVTGTFTGGSHSVTPLGTYSVTTDSVYTYDLVTKETKSVHGGNVMALTNDSRNYFYALVQNGLMLFRILNSYHGIRCESDGIFHWHRLSGWGRQPEILFAGVVHFSDTAKTETPQNRSGNAVVTATSSKNGAVRCVTLSCEAWKSLGSNWNQGLVCVNCMRMTGGASGADGQSSGAAFSYALTNSGNDGTIRIYHEGQSYAFVEVRYYGP